jgi:hypothetical protein
MRLFQSRQGDSVARSCPVCGKSHARTLGQLKRTFVLRLSKDEWDFVQCNHCDLLYISPAPTADDLRTIYVDSGQFDDPAYTDPTRVALIVEYMNDSFRGVVQRTGHGAHEPVTVLEVGAHGRAGCLARSGCQVPLGGFLCSRRIARHENRSARTLRCHLTDPRNRTSRRPCRSDSPLQITTSAAWRDLRNGAASADRLERRRNRYHGLGEVFVQSRSRAYSVFFEQEHAKTVGESGMHA